VASYPQLELDRQLCFPLYAASRAMTRAYTPLLEPVGLTYPQYLALLALWADDGITVGELGRRLRLDSGTLTPLLKRLEAAGLVSRRRDPDDERRVVLTVTETGWELRRAVAHVPAALADRVGLDAAEARTLHGLLHRVLDVLDPDDASSP
jgi:DNA-binding MarR family transcriptional regulator